MKKDQLRKLLYSFTMIGISRKGYFSSKRRNILDTPDIPVGFSMIN